MNLAKQRFFGLRAVKIPYKLNMYNCRKKMVLAQTAMQITEDTFPFN